MQTALLGRVRRPGPAWPHADHGEPFRDTTQGGRTRLFYSHNGSAFAITEPINGEEATYANGGTIGFKCDSAEQVQQFHDTAVAHGGVAIEDPPGLRKVRVC